MASYGFTSKAAKKVASATIATPIEGLTFSTAEVGQSSELLLTHWYDTSDLI